MLTKTRSTTIDICVCEYCGREFTEQYAEEYQENAGVEATMRSLCLSHEDCCKNFDPDKPKLRVGDLVQVNVLSTLYRVMSTRPDTKARIHMVQVKSVDVKDGELVLVESGGSDMHEGCFTIRRDERILQSQIRALVAAKYMLLRELGEYGVSSHIALGPLGLVLEASTRLTGAESLLDEPSERV